MRKFLFPGLVGLLLVILAACGSSATAVPAAKQAPAAPAAVAAPAAPAAAAKPAAPAAVAAPAAAPAAAAQPAAPAAVAAPAAPAAVAAPAVSPALAAYAAQYAGKPGAVYVGDLKQLVGPAPTKDQGDFDGNVPLDALQRHLFVYESAYYKGLLEKAKLANPTPLVSTGQSITIQHACVNRSLLWCKLVDSFFFPNVLARTRGQLQLKLSSYPELGIGGTDNIELVADGTLALADIVGPFVAGRLPALEIQYLFGAFTTREAQFVTTAAITPDIIKLLEESTGGGKHLSHNWVSGADIFFFSKKALRTVEDFKGVKTRSFGSAIGDWIVGMGADPQFVPFAEVYTALERGILGAGVSGGDPGHGQRWYEVTKYINGPLISWPATDMVLNKKAWEKLPPDLQQILIEEGGKYELELLRLGSIQNEVGLEKNIKAGMEYVEFSPEVRARSDTAVIERVIPLWAKRTGGPNAPFVKIFNEKVGPVVGYRVEPDGSAVRVPIVKAK
jgi:TRAP-type C4-dicarboxylate transport system substrate-binding protein